jgi:hypothetical protein
MASKYIMYRGATYALVEAEAATMWAVFVNPLIASSPTGWWDAFYTVEYDPTTQKPESVGRDPIDQFYQSYKTKAEADQAVSKLGESMGGPQAIY